MALILIMQTACGAEELPRSQAVLAWQSYLWAQHHAWNNQGETQRVVCHHRRGTVDPPGNAHRLARGAGVMPLPARTGFNNCEVNNIRLQGESRATFYEPRPPSTLATVHYEGELRFSRRLRGLCTLLIEEAGTWPNTSYTGWFCGHDASELPLPAKR